MIAIPDRALLLALHDEQLARHGGVAGLIDPARLDALLDGFAARADDPDADIRDMVAGFALDVLRERPFLDGNERTAFALLATVLALNNVAFEPPEVEATLSVLAVASGEIGPETFAAWVRARATPVERRAGGQLAAERAAAP